MCPRCLLRGCQSYGIRAHLMRYWAIGLPPMNFRRWGNTVQPLTPWDKIQPPNYGPSQWGAPPPLPLFSLLHLALCIPVVCPVSSGHHPLPLPVGLYRCCSLCLKHCSFSLILCSPARRLLVLKTSLRCTAYWRKPFVYSGFYVPRCLSFDIL